jgi:hypothetical protein
MLLVLLIGGSIQAGAVSDTDSAVGNQLAHADNAAQARAAAFEARSQEALTLINRGNGAANETNWLRGDDVVQQELDRRLGFGDTNGAPFPGLAAYEDYRAAHTEIRKLDNAGNWDEAVAMSLGKGVTATGTNAAEAFDQFDRQVGQVATDESTSASARLRNAVSPLNLLRNIVFVAGLLVAALAALGFGQRLREYR